MSRELLFVVSCCHSAFARKVEPELAVLEPQVDWPMFLRLARFHRVQGLLWNALAGTAPDLPSEIADGLAADAASIAQHNLRAAAESAALLQAFEVHGIPLLFVKGLTLGKVAYGTIATKASVDIDVMTEAARLAPAASALRERGYRLCEPDTETKLSPWHALRKESMWLRDDPPLQVDLHTRLADNPRLIPTIGIESARQTVEVAPGIQLPTLAGDELFAYLAVHGASSAWFRLKWITDFAALIHHHPPQELERLHRRSLELGAGRAAAQALLLADSLFGTLSEAPALKQSLRRDSRSRLLFGIARRQLSGCAEPIEPTSTTLGTAAIHYSQFLLLPGLAFKLSELIRQGHAAVA